MTKMPTRMAKKPGVSGQIMDLTHRVGRSGSLVLVFGGDGVERTAQSRNRLLNRVGASSV